MNNERKAVCHELKTFPEYFVEIVNGNKAFEIRLNDRDYRIGDSITLKEWTSEDGYSGREIHGYITYILTDDFVGLTEGYVALGLEIGLIVK